jgi:hypothetical protein
MVSNGLDFVLFLVIDKVRWWSRVILAILISLDMGREVRCYRHMTATPSSDLMITSRAIERQAGENRESSFRLTAPCMLARQPFRKRNRVMD